MHISRRDLFGGLAGLAATRIPFAPKVAPPKFRFAHLTDLHIQPELGAFDGVSLAVKKVLSLKQRPDFIVIGGDAIMDALNCTADRAETQFKLLKEALKPLEMPIYWCVGNHDVYGWDPKSETNSSDPGYGKAMWMEKVNQKESYFSFDHKGWHFVVLDTIMARSPKGWGAEVGDAQLDWLQKDLSASHKPTIAVAHVPLFTIFNQYQMGSTLPSSDRGIVRNSKDVFKLIQGKNVKLVLQGHTHVVESCTYLGTNFYTAGAISGEWWKGPRLGVHPEGFTVCDVAGDEVSTTYVPFGWHART